MKALLKKLGVSDDPLRRGFDVMKYWHPDAGNKIEFVQHVETEEQAQEICSRPESSFKEGPESDWYFLGYVPAGSRTRHLTAWSPFK